MHSLKAAKRILLDLCWHTVPFCQRHTDVLCCAVHTHVHIIQSSHLAATYLPLLSFLWDVLKTCFYNPEFSASIATASLANGCKGST